MYFVNCKQILLQGHVLCSFVFFDRNENFYHLFIDLCLDSETYRHQIVLLSNSQFGLLRQFMPNSISFFALV